VLMRILPGVAGAEFAPFAAGLTRIQRLLGEHFAPAQQGRVYSSAAVGRLVEWIAAHTPAGIGQSSWGPTGFAVLPSAEAAQHIVDAARAAGVVDAALALHVVSGCSHGALLTPLDSLTSIPA
jgi:beta-ribofuranosylaminobenzene 5'-phosphate synthase